jgi:hypothetical protein
VLSLSKYKNEWFHNLRSMFFGLSLFNIECYIRYSKLYLI